MKYVLAVGSSKIDDVIVTFIGDELRARRDFSDCDVEQTVRWRCSISQAARSPVDKAAGCPVRRPIKAC